MDPRSAFSRTLSACVHPTFGHAWSLITFSWSRDSVSFPCILEGALQETGHPLVPSPGNQGTLWEPHKHITPRWSKIGSSKEKSPGRKRRKPEVSRFPGAGFMGPALQPARGRAPFPNAGDILKAACNTILMSREESVSQKSLKYDHM